VGSDELRAEHPPTGGSTPRSGWGAGPSPARAVLVVEDESIVRALITRALTADGHHVVGVEGSREALRVLDTRPFDLALLDIHLPKLDGLELCRRIVSRYALPVVFVTARDEVGDVARGMEAGAVDYITQPFKLSELRACVNEALGRVAEERSSDHLLEIEDLRIDTNTGEVSKGGESIRLTMTEFRLLTELVMHRGLVISRSELLEKVWLSSEEDNTRLVDMAIRRLRKKVEEDPTEPRVIKTVRGRGYTVE